MNAIEANTGNAAGASAGAASGGSASGGSRHGSEKRAYGGVLFDAEGRVLLRKPANEYDGYVWTFAKGGGAPGQSPEEIALTEVLEETGYRARILEKLPGSYAGLSTTVEYFLMEPVGEPQVFDSETEQTIWVSPDDAPDYIRKTRNEKGVKRDLEVLRTAIEAYRRRIGHRGRGRSNA